MRSLNYVQRVSLDFAGTLFPHAICLGDADNDSVKKSFVNFLNFICFSFICSQLRSVTPGAEQNVSWTNKPGKDADSV